jgi:hypothetical protein
MLRTGLFAIVVLLASHRSAQAEPVIVFDNLPPADTPLSAEGFGIQRAFEPPYVLESELAVRFVAPAGEPLRLEVLTLGLFRGPEEDGAVTVSITEDEGDAPGPAVLDVIDVASADVPVFAADAPPLVLALASQPVLEPGAADGIVVSPAPPGDVARRVNWAVGGTDAVITEIRQSIDPDSQPRGPWIAFATDVRLRVEAAPVHAPPVCAPDAYATDEDRALVVAGPGVLANDVDPDGEALTAILVEGPRHGTVDLAADGGFRYTPARDHEGADGFRYRASDGEESSAVIDVAIAVRAINDAPVNTVPGPQSVLLGLGVLESAVFDLGVADADAGGAPVRVTLTATSGRVSLARTSGLVFSAGDGNADTTMTFTGTLPAIGAALVGVRYTPSLLAFLLAGRGTVQLTSDDLGNTGAPGPLTDTDTVLITRG